MYTDRDFCLSEIGDFGMEIKSKMCHHPSAGVVAAIERRAAAVRRLARRTSRGRDMSE